MRTLVVALLMLLWSWPSAGQVVEVGANVAAACLGSDGSPCGSGTHPLVGAHASWWVTEGLELTGRVGHVGRPSRTFETTFPVLAQVTVDDRSRDFVSALVVHHFRRDLPVRPWLGAGYGVFADAQRVRCEPLACAQVPGSPPEGSQRRWRTDVILALGLSGLVGERWAWRAGCLSHRFANDENSTIETFAGVGYRFGSR
jgi:hypothetical protein